jgi:hypothetical protein
MLQQFTEGRGRNVLVGLLLVSWAAVHLSAPRLSSFLGNHAIPLQVIMRDSVYVKGERSVDPSSFARQVNPHIPTCDDPLYAQSAACVTVDGHHNHADFDEALQGCVWESGHNHIWAKNMRWRTGASDLEALRPKMHNLTNTSIDGIKQDIKFCKHESWWLWRIGPFVSHGGYEWHTVEGLWRMPSEMGMPVYVDHGQVVAVTAALAGNVVGEPGAIELVRYPPIHQHHFHISPGAYILVVDIQTHGDSQCVGPEGMYCTLLRPPPGYAFFLSAPMGFETEFNDVRAHGSLPYSSDLLVVLKVEERVSQRPVLKHYTWMRPAYGPFIPVASFREISLTPTPCLPNNDRCPRGCCVKTDVPGYAWKHEKTYWKPDEKNMNFWLHSHQGLLEDTLLFQGAPDAVFMNLSDVGAIDTLYTGQDRVDKIKQSILQRQKLPGAAPMMCSYRVSGAEELVSFGLAPYVPAVWQNGAELFGVWWHAHC